MKTLSVIIPVYNEEQYLERCLDSLLDCDKSEVEVIVVDDGSTDESGHICDKYAYDFKVIHQKNQGVSAARNTGIENASGKYITFLDSDDEMTERGIDIMLNAITERDGQEIMQFEHERYYKEIDKLTVKYTNHGGFYNYNGLCRMWCMVWNKVYLRSFIEEHHIRFKVGMQYGEDEIFNLDCLLRCKVFYHYEKPTIRRHFENKGSLAHIKDREKLLKQSEALEEILWREGLPSGFENTVRGILAEHWGSKTYCKIFGGIND